MLAGIPKTLRLRFVVVGAVAVLLTPLSAWSQQSSSSGQTQVMGSGLDQDAAQTGADETGESSSKRTSTSLKIPEPLPVRELGRARLLRRERSPLQFGPIYVGSASFYYVQGNSLAVDPTSRPVTDAKNSAAAFRADIVYDRQFRRGRLSAQYQPSLAILNGEVQRNLSNHSLSFDASYLLSRRWTMAINDTFGSVGNNRILTGNFYLDVDPLTGTTLRTPLVDIQNRSISNYSSLTLNYQLGARDQLSIGPRFDYERSTFASSPTSSYTYGTSLSWAHTLGPRRGFGLSYTVEKRQFSQTFRDALYQSVGIGYSQELGHSWQMHLAVAGSSASDTAGRHWTMTGDASLVKQFRRSLWSLTYYRGNNFGAFLTNRYAERVDLGYGIRLARRWDAGASVGYYRASSTIPSRVSGYYGAAQVSYRMLRRLSWFMQYGRKSQRGDSRDIIAGDRYFLATGLRWEARPQEY